MAALAHISREVKTMEESSSMGFTPSDRETLVTVKVQLGYLKDTVDSAVHRIAKLEETRITTRELEELMGDTDTLRVEKQALEVRVTALENWRWFIVGASAAGGFIVSLLFKVLGK